MSDKPEPTIFDMRVKAQAIPDGTVYLLQNGQFVGVMENVRLDPIIPYLGTFSSHGGTNGGTKAPWRGWRSEAMDRIVGSK